MECELGGHGLLISSCSLENSDPTWPESALGSQMCAPPFAAPRTARAIPCDLDLLPWLLGPELNPAMIKRYIYTQ